MNKKRLAAACMMAMMTVSTVMTGCGKTAKEETKEAASKNAVCYVIAPTANSQGLNYASDTVVNQVKETIKNEGYISIVNVDGSPEVIYQNSYELPEAHKNASDKILESDANKNATALLQGMVSVVPNDEETDYMEALTLGLRVLSSLEGYDSKEMVVLGTGLSTSGIVDFQDNLLSAEPEEIVGWLEENESIPDFSDVKVTWMHMGDTAEPQEKLSPKQKEHLKEIWTGIVEAGNGTIAYDNTTPVAVNEDVEYPEVSTIELPEESKKFEPGKMKGANELSTPVIIGEDQVQFIPDKAEYKEKKHALEVLRPVADYLKEYESVNVLLIGATAGDDNTEFSMKLSKERAEAVKNTLTELGVSKKRLTAIGLGCDDPWHTKNVGYEGKAAAGNRKVVLLDTSTKLAKELMKK